MFGLEVTPF